MYCIFKTFKLSWSNFNNFQSSLPCSIINFVEHFTFYLLAFQFWRIWNWFISQTSIFACDWCLCIFIYIYVCQLRKLCITFFKTLKFLIKTKSCHAKVKWFPKLIFRTLLNIEQQVLLFKLSTSSLAIFDTLIFCLHQNREYIFAIKHYYSEILDVNYMQNRKSIMALFTIMCFKNRIVNILSAHLIWCMDTNNTYREHDKLCKTFLPDKFTKVLTLKKKLAHPNIQKHFIKKYTKLTFKV